MNVRLNFAMPLFSNQALQQSQGITGQMQVEVKSPESQETTKFQGDARNILKKTLHEYSPQELNTLHESAVDGRVKLYGETEEGKKEPFEVFVNKVTNRVNQGKASGESADELNGLLDRISQGAEAAHSETRSVLAALSKLDAGTESYIAQSQSFTRFALKELNAKIGEDEELAVNAKEQKDLTLKVKTRDGDEINISIKQSRGWDGLTFGDQVDVSYEVDGDLSASEHKALSELMNAVGQASDSLLAGNDLTDLMGVKGFNGDQLAGFSLALSGSGQDIEYSYSHDGDSQNLTGSWTQDGEVKADFQLHSKLGGSTTEHEMAQYLGLIEEAADSGYKGNDNEQQSDQTSSLFKDTFSDFMQLADKLGKSLDHANKEFDQARTLADALFTEMNNKQAARLGLPDEEKARLKEGFNRLADFSVNLVSGPGGKQSQGNIEKNLQTGYQIELAQRTQNVLENTEQGTQQAIKQTRKVVLDGLMRGGKNERDHQLTENYEITAAAVDFSMKAVKQSRDTEEHLKEKLYMGMGEYLFQQTDRKTKSENNLYILEEGSLETSHLSGEESFKKGIMAGAVFASLREGKTEYDQTATLLITKDEDFRNAQEIAMSIESQKRLLDELLDSV